MLGNRGESVRSHCLHQLIVGRTLVSVYVLEFSDGDGLMDQSLPKRNADQSRDIARIQFFE